MTNDAIAPLPGSEPEHAVPQLVPVREPVLVTVGDMGCTAHWVLTPSGVHPLAGTIWIVTHQTTLTRRIPSYAIVLAILFAVVCLLGLLFLAVREERLQGFVQVSVHAPDGFYYATQVPITDQRQVLDTEQRVTYIRGLATPHPAG